MFYNTICMFAIIKIIVIIIFISFYFSVNLFLFFNFKITGINLLA